MGKEKIRTSRQLSHSELLWTTGKSHISRMPQGRASAIKSPV